MEKVARKAITVIAAAATALGMAVAPVSATAEEKAPTPAATGTHISQPFFFQINGPGAALLLGIGGLGLIAELLTGNSGSSSSSSSSGSSENTTTAKNGTGDQPATRAGSSTLANVIGKAGIGTISRPDHDYNSQLCRNDFFRPDRVQQLFLELLNKERRKNGLKELVPGPPGTDAERWIKYATMKNTNKKYSPTADDVRHWDGLFDHVDSEVINRANLCSIKRHFDSLMGSPGHRDIMMNPEFRYTWTDTGYRVDSGKVTFVFMQGYKK